MKEVAWSVDALDDLENIITYIATDNPRAALSVVDRIEACGNALGEMAIGRRGRVSGTYETLVIGLPYIIAYAIQRRSHGAERIVILRVIHMARD